MAKRRHLKGGRTTPKGTRPAERRSRHDRHHDDDLPPIVGDVVDRLEEPSPFGLLALASMLIEVATPRPTDFLRRDSERPDGPAVFASFADSGIPAMGALALAVATLHPDEVLAARLRRTVAGWLRPSEPRWLATMGDITITDTMIHDEVLGDGENLVMSWRWPDGHAGTAVVYVDHNMGTIVKDAFALGEGAGELEKAYRRLGSHHISRRPISPADVRARLEEAIGHGEIVVPPCETDTWPSCRPMVEWLIRHLPPGGTASVRPDWSHDERERLLDDFVASPFGIVESLSAEQVRHLADPLVWFACDFGPGDPLRWSPVSVEIVLADWYPRKVYDSAAELRPLPEVLAGLVRFAHDRRRIPTDLTEQTLEAIDEWRDDYYEGIARTGRSPGANAARLARIAIGLDPDEFDDDDELDDVEHEMNPDGWLAELDEDELFEVVTDALEEHVLEMVGGPQALTTLDTEPLDDIPFDWSRIPQTVHTETAATLELLDRWSVELYDTEVRTIARAVLAGIVVADPKLLTRSDRTDLLASAILFLVAQRVTEALTWSERAGLGWPVTTQKELAIATGVKPGSLSTRVQSVGPVVDRADIRWPAVLHSTQRRTILRVAEVVAESRRLEE